jgi:hypothetical protein
MFKHKNHTNMKKNLQIIYKKKKNMDVLNNNSVTIQSVPDITTKLLQEQTVQMPNHKQGN